MKTAMLLHPSIPLDLRVCGGLERTALEELARLNQRGHPTRLYAASVRGSHEQVAALRDTNWRSRIGQWPYYLRFLRAARGSDILHGHYTPALATLCPQRSLIHLQGLAVAEIPLYRYLHRRADRAHFACCARHIADKLANRYPRLPDSHIHVLYNAADVNLFRPAPDRLSDGLVHLDYHSLWEEPKGIFDLLQAVELLESKRQDFRLHLVGSALFEGAGPQQEADQRRVEEWAAKLQTVEIVGPLTHPQLAEHLRRMDIGVFPSNHEEPFGNAAVEIMASGLPVVAFDIGGPREIVVEGQTGFLVENKNVPKLAQALERLIENPQLRWEMGQKARKRVEQHFTWDRHVDKLLEIYEQMVRENRRHGRR